MTRTRRHRLINWLPALIVASAVGMLVWSLSAQAGSTAMADPPAGQATPAATPTVPDPALPATAPAVAPSAAEPTVTISAGPGTAGTATESATRPVAASPATGPSTEPTDGPTVFGLARTRLAASDLVGAREVINNALIAQTLSSTEALEARKMIAEMSKTLIFSARRLPDDPWTMSHMVESGEVPAKLASINGLTSSFLLQINGIADARRMKANFAIKTVKGPFHAVVNKRTFTMDIYLGAAGGTGSMYVTSYPVGLGSDDSTPTGKWIVEPGRKLRYPTYYPPPGQGPVIEAEDPKNPLGRYWIGLKGIDGQSVGRMSYGIHGTIEPDSIGKQASLGCIRLLNQDVAQVFDLLVEGKSTVVVLP